MRCSMYKVSESFAAISLFTETPPCIVCEKNTSHRHHHSHNRCNHRQHHRHRCPHYSSLNIGYLPSQSSSIGSHHHRGCSPSVCLPFYLPVCFSFCVFACLSGCRSVCLPLFLPVFLSVRLSVCLAVCLSSWLSFCLSVCMSIHS